jgi:hypothetical protein
VKMSLPEVLTQKITAFGADNVLVIGGRIEGDSISAFAMIPANATLGTILGGVSACLEKTQELFQDSEASLETLQTIHTIQSALKDLLFESTPTTH